MRTAEPAQPEKTMPPLGQKNEPPVLTAADADALEDATGFRHEFYGGRPVAMSGGTLRHNAIAINVLSSLLAQLRGKPCRPYMADVRLQVYKAKAHFYPDVLVLCGDRGGTADTRVATDDATSVDVVLSASTANIDRSIKMRAYRQLPSLAAYVLVAQEDRQVEVYVPGGDIGWSLIAYRPGEIVHLPGINLDMAVDDVYADTDTPVVQLVSDER